MAHNLGYPIRGKSNIPSFSRKNIKVYVNFTKYLKEFWKLTKQYSSVLYFGKIYRLNKNEFTK